MKSNLFNEEEKCSEGENMHRKAEVTASKSLVSFFNRSPQPFSVSRNTCKEDLSVSLINALEKQDSELFCSEFLELSIPSATCASEKRPPESCRSFTAKEQNPTLADVTNIALQCSDTDLADDDLLSGYLDCTSLSNRCSLGKQTVAVKSSSEQSSSHKIGNETGLAEYEGLFESNDKIRNNSSELNTSLVLKGKDQDLRNVGLIDSLLADDLDSALDDIEVPENINAEKGKRYDLFEFFILS